VLAIILHLQRGFLRFGFDLYAASLANQRCIAPFVLQRWAAALR